MLVASTAAAAEPLHPKPAMAARTSVASTPEPANRNADRVTLSEAGRRAAQTPETPLEMYQLPTWMAGSYIKVPATLGGGADWLAERYPQVAAASSGERGEYASLLQNTYQALLKDNGIQGVEDHYRAMILDGESSESLRLQMRERVAANPRLLELMSRLGLGAGLS